MTEALVVTAIVLLAVVVVLVVLVLNRVRAGDPSLAMRLDSFGNDLNRTEQSVREQLTANRGESQRQAHELRQEVSNAIKDLRESVGQQLIQLSKLQHDRLEASTAGVTALTQSLDTRLGAFQETMMQRLSHLSDSNEKRLDGMRGLIDERLRTLQADNAIKLDQMRATVDEKLQSTLEKRLGESFKLVSERLEQVHSGLGEMKTLATGVGDLKKVLTNVKVRGTFGEVQLDNLLEQFLSPEQYSKNVATKEGSAERVEFAIRLPGPDGREGNPVWLPIDAKFPTEDYLRLVTAYEAADLGAIDQCGKELEKRVKSCAKDIADKYVNPPVSTNFGIMYLPTEGLYAEVTRRTELCEMLRRDFKVEVAGPSTLPAFLMSWQMGFRTLAIQKRSSEVWSLLAGIKKEFGTYGDLLAKVRKKLDEASATIDEDLTRRTKVINRKLKNVEETPPIMELEVVSELPPALPLPAEVTDAP